MILVDLAIHYIVCATITWSFSNFISVLNTTHFMAVVFEKDFDVDSIIILVSLRYFLTNNIYKILYMITEFPRNDKDAIPKCNLILIPDKEVGNDMCQIQQPALNNRFYVKEED